MIKVWHYIYYSLYKLNYRAQQIFNKPFLYIYKIPIIKKYLSTKSYSPEELVNELNKNRDYGIGVLFSSYTMYFLLFSILFTVYNSTLIIFNIFIEFEIYIAVLIMILSLLLNNFIFLKEGDYQSSFLEFDHYNKVRKRFYYISSFVIMIILFLLFYLSFVYDDSIHHSIINKK